MLDRIEYSLRRWAGATSTRLRLSLGLLAFVILYMPSAAARVFEPLLDYKLPTMSQAAMGVAAIAVFVFAFWALSAIASTVLWSNITKLDGKDSKAEGLVMGLSVPRKDALASLNSIKQHFKSLGTVYGMSEANFIEHPDYERLKEAYEIPLNWQQNIRAIAYHHATVKHIRVLLSKETKDHWPDFQSLVQELFGKDRFSLSPVMHADGQEFHTGKDEAGGYNRDYENYAFVRNGFSVGATEIEKLLKNESGTRSKFRPPKICLDITAGIKMSSIAGAIVTLNRDLLMAYANNKGDYSVYRMHLGTADGLTRSLSG